MIIYLPTLLLVIISYSTNFYLLGLFSTQVCVNLTCMLVSSLQMKSGSLSLQNSIIFTSGSCNYVCFSIQQSTKNVLHKNGWYMASGISHYDFHSGNYIHIIDYHCYFFSIIFLKVLLQTLADSYRIKERSNENSKKFFDTRESIKKNIQNVYSDDYYDPKTVSVIKKVLFVGIPSIFLLFSVIYWLVGLYNHYISSSVVH